MAQNTEDALDIELTKDDIEAMAPDTLHSMYAKVRQSRNDLREQRLQLQAQLQGARDDNHRMTQLAQYYERQMRDRDARLSLFAMRVIDAGVLDATTLALGGAERAERGE